MIISIMNSMPNQDLLNIAFKNVILLKSISQFKSLHNSISGSNSRQCLDQDPEHPYPLIFDSVLTLQTVSTLWHSLTEDCFIRPSSLFIQLRSQDLFPNLSGFSVNSLFPLLYFTFFPLNVQGTGKVIVPNTH